MIADGDFEKMFERYFDHLVRRIEREFGFSHEDACDIAQDAFVSVYKYVKGPIRSEWGFLLVTARNLAKNAITRKRLGQGVDLDDIAEPVDPGANPEVALVDAEKKQEEARTIEELKCAIQDLPPGTRDCLMHRISGLRYRQIAKAMGISEDAVRARLHYAKTLLRKRFGDHFKDFDPPGDSDD